MTTESTRRRLSRIQTHWSVLRRACQGQGEESADAKRHVLLRYYRPVYLYLCAIVHDPAVAEELAQEFAVRLMRGDFSRADPARGRFRDLLKRAVRHLVIDHWRRERVERRRCPFTLGADPDGTPAPGDWRHGPPSVREGAVFHSPEADQAFHAGWREELLARAWRMLRRFEKRTRSGYHTALRLRTEWPDVGTDELTRMAVRQLGEPLSEAAYRQLLCRARKKFADFLVAVVAASLPNPDCDSVEEELIELGLLRYCRHTVARLRGDASRPRRRR